MKDNYVHVSIPELSTDFFQEGDFVVRNYKNRTDTEIIDVAILTTRLAKRIGIKIPNSHSYSNLPYDNDNDNLLFNSPLCSILFGKDINFFRSWKQFESCIKGFNALGLMSEQLRLVINDLSEMHLEELNQEKIRFLNSRKDSNLNLIFEKSETNKLTIEDVSRISTFDLAIWKAFGNKTIVCSTSSNMGISLHDALRFLQKTEVQFKDKSFKLLNQDEGGLIIWAPGEEADFMNYEKTSFLRSLEAQKPALTKLRPYINRTQRDPGALKDALACGGYFFPTNPQSKDEIQNLLFYALNDLANDRAQTLKEVIQDKNVKETLKSLKCTIENDKVYIDDGVESGISGLMVPYLLMLEELLSVKNNATAISTWNQASIGAALAAIIKCDMILRDISKISEKTRSNLFNYYPNISKFSDSKKIGKDIDTSIHGVFDLANIQSLAQLLGVVVEKHLSGKGTAFVGLGSSSYSNGNRCYELLKESFENNGPFLGKDTFHPSTHTLNYFAQALVYGEDVYRATQNNKYNLITIEKEKLEFIKKKVRKPEPAGGAAMAGYILTRLDGGTLSIIEIAFTMKLMGFTKNSFLSFANFKTNNDGVKKLLQECYEEGTFMGNLAKNILHFLEWPIKDLEKKANLERSHSRLRYRLNPINSQKFENKNQIINIYLTGDNTFQPELPFIEKMIALQFENKDQIKKLIYNYLKREKKQTNSDLISFVGSFFSSISSFLKKMELKVNIIMNNSVSYLVKKKAKKLTK